VLISKPGLHLFVNYMAQNTLIKRKIMDNKHLHVLGAAPLGGASLFCLQMTTQADIIILKEISFSTLIDTTKR
jgi:hypothetical protein